ncbi:unnamed protein product [Rangifer tarandus platyrhynchus]|uniref:Uncharacterized protein n=1 Tax=Rangifer tarandus platyrhynchus TaxID=3082113 RepID=A0ABN8XYN1_RANTA|nr:unnamed protein product [Rangifer tarandus platyrhynchus]
MTSRGTVSQFSSQLLPRGCSLLSQMSRSKLKQQGADAQDGLHSSDGPSRDDRGPEAGGPSCVQRVASWVLLCSCQDLCFLVRPSHVAPGSRGARLLGEQPGALQAQEQKPPAGFRLNSETHSIPPATVCCVKRSRQRLRGGGRGQGLDRVQGGEVPWELSQEPTATAKSRAAVSRGPHLSPAWPALAGCPLPPPGRHPSSPGPLGARW